MNSKIILKLSAAAAVALSLVAAPSAVSAQTEVSANAGFMSKYYYRGIPQEFSSASAGLDVSAGSFSAGTWAADVNGGSEIDLYAGVGFPLGESASVSIGGTGYFYTDPTFDVTYLEGNLGLGLGPLSVELSGGSHQRDPDATKYLFLGVTVEHMGFYVTAGSFSESMEFGDAFGDLFTLDAADLPATTLAGSLVHGQYLEGGYGFSAADLDFVVSGVWSDSEIAASPTNTGELTLLFAVSKTFDIDMD